MLKAEWAGSCDNNNVMKSDNGKMPLLNKNTFKSGIFSFNVGQIIFNTNCYYTSEKYHDQ